jgi:hypothetical protein
MCIFCNKCGVENTEDAKYCQECGNEIVKNQSNDSKIDDIKSNNKNLNEKSPLGAAALNLIIAGAGFIYIHEYAKAVLSFIIVLIAGIIGFAMGLSFLLSVLALILVMAWSYDETKKYNKNLT